MEKINSHLLIVDDDDRIRELVKEYLTENNYIVSTANSAEEAKKMILNFKFIARKWAGPKNFLVKTSFGSENVSL